MTTSSMDPCCLAMFTQQEIEGDEALLRLMQSRFEDAGLGAEFYPGDVEHLARLLEYQPQGLPCTAHLPRHINILSPEGREAIMAFARVGANRIYGMVAHDQPAFADNLDHAVDAFGQINGELARIDDCPYLFVEYAVGLSPAVFSRVFELSRDLRYVLPCVDVGHVGIRVCQLVHANRTDGAEICALSPTTEGFPEMLQAVQHDVAEALPAVLALIGRLGAMRRPLHLHLHDGHPLSTLSPYGVCDHLSFDQEIRLPFAWGGRKLMQGMFGLAGLRAIVAKAMSLIPPEHMSFMLEIHPQAGRLPLGAAVDRFAHWADVSNAERMAFWQDVLRRNALFLRDAIASA